MATYYIDPAGDNGNDGSFGSPWASLSYAASQVLTSGNTIYVNSGNYTDNSQVVLAVGVSILGNSITRPTITTSFKVDGSDISQPYIKAANSVIGGTSENGNQTISYINFNGNNSTGRTAITAYYRSNVRVHDCDFENFRNHAVVFVGCPQLDVDAVPMPIPVNYATGNKVYNCNMTNCTYYADGAHYAGEVYLRGQSGTIIDNCSFDQTGRAAGLNGQNLKIDSAKGCLITNSEFYRLDDDNDIWNMFMENHNCFGMELSYCDFHGMATCDLSGAQKGDYEFGWYVHHNTFDTETGSLTIKAAHGPCFVCFEAFDKIEDSKIMYNYFKNGNGSIVVDNSHESCSRVTIAYNIIEGIGSTTNVFSNGIRIISDWGGSTPKVYTDIKIWNNVLTGSAVVSNFGILLDGYGDLPGFEIVNNIVYGNNNIVYPIYLAGRAAGCEITNGKFNKNILFGNTNNDIYYNEGANPITYTTCDTTDDVIVDDPLFIGTGTPPANYQLQDSSPAINAGIDVGLISDFIGTVVPYGSAPDIGAYEWFEILYDFTKITLVNTPACYNAVDNTIISRWVATECPINFTLLRRDWYVINSSDVGGFLAISVYGTFSGNDGDVISVYDLTTNSMYTGTITDKSGDPVLITDIPYVSGMDIKYLNDHTLYAGYYFEGRLTINGVVESLTVIASPDSFGYADLDVSGILRIKTSIGKVTNYLSLIQKDTNKSGQFTLEYRGCWYGSNEAWISEGSQTSPASEVVWYYAECVRSEEQGCNLAEYVPTDQNDAPFLNQFDTPVYWYGLPFDLSFILPERPELSPTSDIIVTMKVYNSANVQMGADIVQTIDVDSLEGYVNSLNIDSTLIDAGAAYFTVEIFSM